MVVFFNKRGGGGGRERLIKKSNRREQQPQGGKKRTHRAPSPHSFPIRLPSPPPPLPSRPNPPFRHLPESWPTMGRASPRLQEAVCGRVPKKLRTELSAFMSRFPTSPRQFSKPSAFCFAVWASGEVESIPLFLFVHVFRQHSVTSQLP